MARAGALMTGSPVSVSLSSLLPSAIIFLLFICAFLSIKDASLMLVYFFFCLLAGDYTVLSFACDWFVGRKEVQNIVLN